MPRNVFGIKDLLSNGLQNEQVQRLKTEYE